MLRAVASWSSISWSPLGAALLIGCSLVTDYEDFGGLSPRRPPARNDAIAGGSGPLRASASISMRFSGLINEPTRPVGYDVDALCTTCNAADAVPSCKNRSTATIACDTNHCIDNQVDEYIKTLGQSLGQSDTSNLQTMSDALTQNLASGAHGVLVEVGEWDGQPDDGDVTFSIYNVTDANQGGGVQSQALNAYAVDDAQAPATLRGYVTQNTLVVRGISFDLILQLAVSDAATGERHPLTVRVPFRNALFVGTIEGLTDSSFKMTDAQITGGLPIGLVLEQIKRFTLCPPSSPFTKACELLDLSVADPQNLEAPCDAMSFAIAMDFADARREGQKAAGDYSLAPSACPEPYLCP